MDSTTILLKKSDTQQFGQMLLKLQKHRESTLTFTTLGMQQCCDAIASTCPHNMKTNSNSIASVKLGTITSQINHQV